MKKMYFHLPGILLFLVVLVAGLASYQHYGVAWDEPTQRYIGTINYTAGFEGDTELFGTQERLYGASFEMILITIERKFNITDSRDIYFMRHLFSHIFFLLAALYGYFFIFRLYGSRALACLGFIMLVLSPRLYAHSFFNSKDIPFMAMTIIVMGLFHTAFNTRRPFHFALLGFACGFATGIRILGIMFVPFILFFLLTDIVVAISKKRPASNTAISMALFTVLFIGSFCLFWPYVWRSPVTHFMECFTAMSHYSAWSGSVLFGGELIKGTELPWSYFPTWFGISNPELWLLAGAAGVIFTMIALFKRPLAFVTDMAARNRLFHFLCFIVPITSVIVLHSVLYDDWRHLYFVYVPFVLMALHVINLAVKTKAKIAVWGACAIQVGVLVFLMVSYHPFHQVYFNYFVSHKKEYLRHNYELEYWGCGFMQGLYYLMEKHHWDEIKVCSNKAGKGPLANAILMAEPRDRSRIKMVPETEATYKITTFRLSQDEPEYPNIEYAIRSYNSTNLCIYRLR